MRRRQHAAHENHERWLVSYADFITLLFAFFVVMFASAQDKDKARRVSASVREALEKGQMSEAVATVLGKGKHENSKPPTSPDRVTQSENLPPVPPPPAVQTHPADLAKTIEVLKSGLAAEVKGGKIEPSPCFLSVKR